MIVASDEWLGGEAEQKRRKRFDLYGRKDLW